MPKSLVIRGIFTSLLFPAFYIPALVFAQTSVTPPPPPAGAEQVGVTGGVRGGVELARGGQIGYVVSSG